MNTYLTYKNGLCSFEDYLKDAYPSGTITKFTDKRLKLLSTPHLFFVIDTKKKDYDGETFRELKIYDEDRGFLEKKKYYEGTEPFDYTVERFWTEIGNIEIRDYVKFIMDQNGLY